MKRPPYLFLCALLFTAMTACADHPNIVILYADDMGYGDLACQNPDSKIPTPHLDRLASEGLRFTDAHSSSGICTPSRYALLTGCYHWRKFHGIVGAFGRPVIEDAELTLAEMLRRRGYHTACIGKWHLGWDWDAIKLPEAKQAKGKGYPPDAFDWSKPIPGGPLAHGFDYYFGDDVPNFPPYTWFENDRVLVAPDTPLKITPKTAEGNWEARPGPMVADWDFHAVMPTLTEKAVEWIGTQKDSDKPFFLYFPFTSPHAPIVPAKEFVGTSRAGGYGDFMAQTDWTVGQVLKALEQSGLADNTLIIFSSDNGPEQYAYPRIQNFNHRSMGPLRGLKRDIWEGGHRVPFIVRWPGVVKPGAATDGLMSQIDLMATLAAVVGSDLPNDAAPDSFDQLALFKCGKSSRTSLVHNTKKNHYAIRQGEWVLIDAPSGGVTRVPAWFNEQFNYAEDPLPGALYHLKKDPVERDNLYEKHPARVMELRKSLALVREASRTRP